jgi:hypothetical protein
MHFHRNSGHCVVEIGAVITGVTSVTVTVAVAVAVGSVVSTVGLRG